MAFIKGEAVMRRISFSGHKDDSWKNPGQLIIYLPHTLSITHTSFHIYVHHSLSLPAIIYLEKAWVPYYYIMALLSVIVRSIQSLMDRQLSW